MGRSAALIATAFMLAACGDFDTSKLMSHTGDFASDFVSGNQRLELESEPAGAEATTSTGQTCRTPCSLAIKRGPDFTVTFALEGYQPQTVPVAQVYTSDPRHPTAPAYADLDPKVARALLVAIPPPPPEPPPPVKKKPRVAAKPAPKDQAASSR